MATCGLSNEGFTCGLPANHKGWRQEGSEQFEPECGWCEYNDLYRECERFED